MNYKVEKKIICEETGKEFCVGDTVSIRYSNGGGNTRRMKAQRLKPLSMQ